MHWRYFASAGCFAVAILLAAGQVLITRTEATRSLEAEKIALAPYKISGEPAPVNRPQIAASHGSEPGEQNSGRRGGLRPRRAVE